MDREEILKRSRAEKQDEGVAYAEDRGRRAAVIGFCAVCAVILLFNAVTGQDSYVPLALFWAYISAESWGKYRVTGTRTYLWTMILGAAGAACWLACHILSAVWR